MIWNKKGLAFSPTNCQDSDWMQEYAQAPCSIIKDKKLLVYFSTRPKANGALMRVAHPAFVEFSSLAMDEVTATSTQPLLELGQLGCFDEFGIMPCSALQHNGKILLYYAGWTRKSSVPYDWGIGLAVSSDGYQFEKYSRGPLFGATPDEPYLFGCPKVQIINGIWHMWYISGISWVAGQDRKESVYRIKHATSDNGIDWQRDGKQIIPAMVEDECQTCFSVIEMDGVYHAWFTYRHGIDFRNPERGYRIGYAYSHDLKHWTRDDSKAGIKLSASGWDSEMVCYPDVFKANDDIHMLYCGNHFGVEGFGHAVLNEGSK
ncbi:hypothetical protein K0504_07240 [Neiella marina]|uniref:Glycosyl hydrolase family 32 N-terminal domain-containing protein n=1 Tax=Neiella holothuriorum TaxID=2870530 RepID=A0ABS7EER8_9GAMM|nr:hypothetical protein [Neiella holothuriorum]MBW8190825.1 hypothetical protein [Neiella holothuriorum]